MAAHVDKSRTFIIRVDEVGSTALDEKAGPPKILARRAKLFGWVIGHLAKASKQTRVIKNVGDELIIRCDHKEDVRQVISALINLVEHPPQEKKKTGKVAATRKRKDRSHTGIRIAVHGNDLYAGFASQKEVDKFVDELRKYAAQVATRVSLADIDAVSGTLKASLINDVFGPAINRASRLSQVSKAPILIASDEVLTVLHDILSSGSESSSGTHVIEWSHPVPLFALKGVDTFNYDHPWLIYQLRTALPSPSRKSTTARRLFDLEVEASGFQALREVHVKFYGSVAENSTAYKDAKKRVRSQLIGNINYPNASSHCVDVIFEVIRQWRVRPYPTDRIANQWINSNFHFEEVGLRPQFRPVFFAFTSVLDEKHDRELRDKLSEPKSKSRKGLGWDTNVVTNYIYGRGKWQGQQIWNKSNIFALVRCFVSEDFFECAEKINKLFENKPRPLPIASEPVWNCVGYGILRGATDAYLLYQYIGLQSETDPNITEFVSHLSQAVIDAHESVSHGGAGGLSSSKLELFGRLIPLSVEILELDTGAMSSDLRQQKLKVLCSGGNHE